MVYQGFDISGLQFPAEIPEGLGDITFSVQDIVKPFPEDHLGQYDIVHVRLLAQGLKEADIESAVRNAAALLHKLPFVMFCYFTKIRCRGIYGEFLGPGGYF